MAEARTNRRLAAILAADVVGYSRLMAADETGTLAALKRHREKIFDPAITEHNGRIVKLIGDGTLVEFGSVVDAVRCALAIQAANANEVGQKPGVDIVLRIGVNLGDIIIEGDDIYGDGVNVAARLEPLAEPGGICIASIVNESLGSRIDISFRDAGDVQVKNIDRPIRVWKWHPRDTAPRSASAADGNGGPPAQKGQSIAVLPFSNMSGDVEQEYFSDGITDDIITDLSKVGGLLVIARNSSFAFKGKNVDIRTIGRDLGVRSVLEGSIRKAGNRVRITAQLIDAATGGHLWAERYDRDLTDIFEVQDEVTRHIVAALKVTLSPAEVALLAETTTIGVDAHDCFLRGRELLFGSVKNRAMFDKTAALFRQAIARDPTFADPYAGLSVLYSFDHQNRWSDDADRSIAEANRFADEAIRRNPKDAFPHYAASVVAAMENDYDRGTRETNIALELSPNFAPAHSGRGIIYLFTGEPLAAIPYIERAMRLDPAFSHQYLHFLGLAYLLIGKYETAAALLSERIARVPETDFSRAYLAATLGHLGEKEQAQQVWRDLLRVNPKYKFEDHVSRLHFTLPADLERIREGLAKAGLPT